MAKIVVFDEESRRALERGVPARCDLHALAFDAGVAVGRTGDGHD